MFKYEIGQVVHFLGVRDGKVRSMSAPVQSRTIVENTPEAEKRACTEEQRNLFLRFGASGIFYATVHGVHPEGELFSSKEDLGRAVADGSSF